MIRPLALLGLLGLAGAACRTPMPVAAQPPASPRTLTLHPYVAGWKTLEVLAGGTPRRFLFDTGGGRTLLSRELAAELGCAPQGRGVGYRMTGERVDYALCDRFEGTVQGFPVRHAPVAVLDLARLLPPELPRLDGILALESFRGQVVTLDWAGGQLRLHPPGDPAAWKATAVPLRIATGENGSSLCVLLPVVSGSDTHWFLLDSGNLAGTLVSTHLLQAGGIPRNAEGLALLSVGGRPVEALPVVGKDIHFDGVLGTHFLQTRVLTLDLRAAP